MGVPAAEAHPRSATSTTGARLKRENFRRTKHDSAFSPWKILIGSSDWEDHSMGKGVEKYRTQNLPNWNPSPGVYELGIAVSSSTSSGRDARKLDSSSVVPVYLGQADNLRIRLQQYGRDGAHLENKKSTNNAGDSSCKGPGLFTDVFAKGFPIVYRCAPMKSKKEAEIIEKQLLDTFDYAWNKGSNGMRRHDDVCKKLDHHAKTSQFSLLLKKFLSFNQKRVGIKITACKHPGTWNYESKLSETDSSITISRVFGIRRVTTMMPPQYDCSDICGVAIGHGSICREPPVQGRKRCAVHKGMRVDGCNSGPKKEGTVDVCGFRIGDGSICKASPVKGRKRCAMHKGMRVSRSVLV